MNALEQAQNFLAKAQYANFFRIMRKNIGENVTLSLLEKELLKNRTDVNYEERLMIFLETQAEYIKMPLPDAEKKEDTIFLTNFTYPSPIIGREKELEDLHTHLQGNLPTVVVNGLGGIGKTTLAREYIKRHEGLYDHIVWLEQTGKPIDAFVGNAILLMELGLTFQNETTEQRFEIILHKLKKITSKNLLVLDNYQQDTGEDAYPFLACFPFSKHWHVFFTSREQIAGFTTMELDILSEEEAIALFKMHCTGKDIDDTELKDLLHEIGYHTLMTEILAKVYNTHTGLHSIADFAGKIQARAIDDNALQRMVATAHSKKEVELYEYLLRVFDFDALPTEALHLLKQIAVLPTEPLPIDFILLTAGEDVEQYRLVLEDLAKKGWVALINNEGVQMHRLIQLLILQKYEPTYQDCIVLHNIIANVLYSDENKMNPLQYKIFTMYADNILQNINYKYYLPEKWELQNILAVFYQVIGNHNKAIALLEQNLLLLENNYNKQNLDYATTLNNLATLYINIGRYDDALVRLEEALEIRKQVLGKQNVNYLNSLNNLSVLYQEIGNYEKSLYLFKEALEIRGQISGKQNLDYATALNNLASSYEHIHENEKALGLYEEALEICEKISGRYNPDCATLLNNLANLYKNMGEYEKSLFIHKDALEIREKILGKQNRDYAISLYNLGTLYIEMEEIINGINCILKSYQILLETVGEEDPYTQEVKKTIDIIENNK